MRRKSIVSSTLTLALLATAGLAAAARGEEGSLRFEKTVPFQRDRLVSLGAQVGPVRVAQVTFATGGGGGGGIGDTIRARVHGGDSDTLTAITASFDSENPTDREWVVTYTLELLDANGKLIDRFSRKESFEGEADVVKAERSILTYVVPLIAKVRIKLEAALD
jgi:hypothetical protein